MPSWLERLRTALAPGIAVEREIASGGMGHVALGRDTVLDRPVAIKLLKPELATAVAAERFLREARHAAGLQHQNVVQVHHAAEKDGLLYYIMDYMPGETLAARLAGGRLPPRGVVRLGKDLLAALGAAHARKLIHRDVKPSNVFLDGDRALLGDFGVVHALDSSQTALTRSGQPVGTLAYISPEQLHDQPVTFQTDIYAVGLVLYEAATGRRWAPLTDPAKGDWAPVPARLREPIRRALRLEPAQRWPDTRSFAEALAAAERRSRWGAVLPWAAGAAIAAALGVGLVAALREGREDPGTADLAIFPFGTVGPADSSMGPRLAGLTGWSFERLHGLRLVERQRAFRAWRASELPPARRLAELTGELGCRYGIWGVVRPRGALLEVRLSLIDGRGVPIFEGTVVGDSLDVVALGDSVARTLVRDALAHVDRKLRHADVLSGVSPAALSEFMLGEEAFSRDAWLDAERHYLRAFQLDRSFLLAAWRLGNTRRWLPLRTEPPYPADLLPLFRSRPEALPEVDRRLLEAQFRPSGEPRFERYEEAIRVAPRDDPYAALLYGDELFHRGPLAGRPLTDAVRVLDHAATTDPTLAPAWEHLAWALIRLGDGQRAGTALARLEQLAGPPEESEIHLPIFLRMAYGLRFGPHPEAAEPPAELLESPSALALAARGALSFDLPEAQASLGAALAGSGAPLEQRASGFIARGVALVALGRPTEALGSFDSAAQLFPSPAESRLQAAEWRVIPAALGAPGVAAGERERGRQALRAMSGDSLLGPRAAWALALDAHARGDTGEAKTWAVRVRARPEGAERLAPLIDALEHAARGRLDAALAASQPLLAYDSAGYAADPFLRAALHLSRGTWLARAGRAAEADRAWLWYENLDLIRWPGAEAQPAEVDWALATYARALRARLAAAGRRERAQEACALARRAAEVWSKAEPAVSELGGEMAAIARRCGS